uniref:Uncharacterized protein n=1 Tax=Arundo donax TaxID=35708 RepID=A0A0A9CHB7_ARUDO
MLMILRLRKLLQKISLDKKTVHYICNH